MLADTKHDAVLWSFKTFTVSIVKIIPTRCNKLLHVSGGWHDVEQQDSDYLQLHTTHTDRTTLLRTNSLNKCARLPVAIHSTCTLDDGWDCHPKHVE